MFKKIFMALLLCLTLIPATTFAADFVTPSEDSALYKKVGWRVDVYQETDDGKKKIKSFVAATKSEARQMERAI